jgi:hypothetical protein
MHVKRQLVAYALIVLGAASASADFITEFSGFNSVNEVGVSGLQSSYFADTKAGLPISGPLISKNLATFGPQRVSYPSGIGQVPSPGGAIGANFDQGALGLKVEGDELIFKVATALDPTAGYYHSGWNTWYGQGDLFVSVQNGSSVNHFALLSAWAHDAKGKTINYNGNYYAKGENFHLNGGAKNDGLEGHLVALRNDSDVLLTGGTGAYTASNAPTGLDRRVFAAGGLDLGNAGLMLGNFTDNGRLWYTQTWRVGISDLSSAKQFDLGLHTAASCGNDQIGGVFSVSIPEPASLLLLICGCAIWSQRRG